MFARETRLHQIAYFSMEVGLDSALPTDSGGLGILAGDTLRAAADLGLPMIGITLLHREGYFHQRLDATGNQSERAAVWRYEEVLEPMVPRAFVPIAGRAVMVRAWRYIVRGVFGHTVPFTFSIPICRKMSRGSKPRRTRCTTATPIIDCVRRLFSAWAGSPCSMRSAANTSVPIT